MPGPTESTAPNVHEMAIIHNGFRHLLGELPKLVARLPERDDHAAELVANHIDIAVAVLHEHHEREDEHLWPLLLQRAEPERVLIERMQAQHAGLSEALDAAAEASKHLRGARSMPNVTQLESACETLRARAEEHMDDEERNILPLAKRVVTKEEWDRMAGDRPPSIKEMAVLLPSIEGNNTPDDVDELLHSLPTPVRAVIVPAIVRPMAKRYRKRLLGSLSN